MPAGSKRDRRDMKWFPLHTILWVLSVTFSGVFFGQGRYVLASVGAVIALVNFSLLLREWDLRYRT